ncbi:MAG: FAD-dependent oxidoreductase, partial [Verrucomicrobiales bacterium]
LYLRSTRRLVSDYVITEADVLARPRTGQSGKVLQPAPPVSDPIGVAWWFVDLHAARTVIKDGAVYNEGAFINYDNYAPFGIPYRAIRPKKSECENLLVPSALSASYAGYGAVRLEWTFFVLGQSAGAAASLALDADCAVQDLAYEKLAAHLRQRGQILTPPPAPADPSAPEKTGLIIDNSAAEKTGTWHTSTRYPGYFGSDYLHDGNEGKGEKSLRFTPDLPAAGRYEVFTTWSNNAPRAKKIPLTITHADGSEKITLNQQEEGRGWQSLGTWNFEKGRSGSLLIETTGTQGYVIADAVRFQKITKKETD